jgi:hypothetical protein
MSIDFSRYKYDFIVECDDITVSEDNPQWVAEAKVLNTSWKYAGPPSYDLYYYTQSSSREEALSLLYEKAIQPLSVESHPVYHELQTLLLDKISSYL